MMYTAMNILVCFSQDEGIEEKADEQKVLAYLKPCTHALAYSDFLTR